MDLRQIKTQTSGHRDCMPSPVRWALPHIMFFESHTLTADPYLLCVRSFCSRKQGVSSCGESVGSLAGKPRWGCILPTLGGKNIKSWSSFPACTFSESLRESLQDLTVQVDQKHQQKKKNLLSKTISKWQLNFSLQSQVARPKNFSEEPAACCGKIRKKSRQTGTTEKKVPPLNFSLTLSRYSWTLRAVKVS